MTRKSCYKGSNFERSVAIELSNWLSQDTDHYIFARRVGSGGFSKDKAGTSGIGGDIFAEKPQGEWFTNHVTIELKFYQDLLSDFWRFICGRSSRFDDFIEQTQKAAKPYQRKWLLICKCNRRPALLLTNSGCVQEVISASSWTIKKKGEKIYLAPFEELLISDPKVLQSIINQKRELVK